MDASVWHFLRRWSACPYGKRAVQHVQCVGGIMVSIAAFQAVDPGSIPGRRSLSFSVAPTLRHVAKRMYSQFFVCVTHLGLASLRLTLLPFDTWPNKKKMP